MDQNIFEDFPRPTREDKEVLAEKSRNVLGNMFTEARETPGQEQTIEEVAKQLDITKEECEAYENGTAFPLPSELGNFAKAYGLPIAELKNTFEGNVSKKFRPKKVNVSLFPVSRGRRIPPHKNKSR